MIESSGALNRERIEVSREVYKGEERYNIMQACTPSPCFEREKQIDRKRIATTTTASKERKQYERSLHLSSLTNQWPNCPPSSKTPRAPVSMQHSASSPLPSTVPSSTDPPDCFSSTPAMSLSHTNGPSS